MIQEEMVFALGFFTAGLVALACLPAVWRRAIRLTSRRLGRLVPLSMDEIVAERDQLRAGFAVGQRRLEQRLDEVEAARSAALIETGRRDARIAALDEEISRQRSRIEALTEDLGATTRELFEVRGETGAAAIALHDLSGLAEQRRWEVLEAEEAARSLQNTVDEGRAAVAAFETRVMGLESRVADLTQELANTRAELSRTVEAVGRAAGERDAARQAAEAIAVKRDALQLRLDEQMAESVQIKAALDQRNTSAETAEHRAADLARTIAAHQARIEELGAERKAAEAGLMAQVEAARNEVRASATAAEELRAEKAALASALAAARASGAANSGKPAETEAELAALRQAIKEVADDVLRMVEARPPGASVSDESSPAQKSTAEAASLLSAG